MAPARVLVSNDDGINAAGLRALVAALAKHEGLEVYVLAPSEERSGQSHAISLARYLAVHPQPGVAGAKVAYAVDGARPRSCAGTRPGAGRGTGWRGCWPLRLRSGWHKSGWLPQPRSGRSMSAPLVWTPPVLVFLQPLTARRPRSWQRRSAAAASSSGRNAQTAASATPSPPSQARHLTR
jgi:hypothetical protein